MQVGPATETDIDFLSMLSREVSRMHADAGPCVFKQATPEACGEGFFRRQLADEDIEVDNRISAGLIPNWAAGRATFFIAGVLHRFPPCRMLLKVDCLDVNRV